MPGEETATEWSVRDDIDTEFVRSLEKADLLVFDVEGEGRVFDLKGSDWMDSMSAAKSVCRALREADIFDFALPVR